MYVFFFRPPGLFRKIFEILSKDANKALYMMLSFSLLEYIIFFGVILSISIKKGNAI